MQCEAEEGPGHYPDLENIVLDIDGLKFGYTSRTILESIDLEVAKGEFVALLGPNGSGKTTLMRCINRIVSIMDGTVCVDGVDLKGLSRDTISRMCTTVPADVPSEFSLSTEEFVSLGRSPYITSWWWESPEDTEIVHKALDDFNLHQHASKKLYELSSGERARALLAKGVVQQPKLMMVDEPSAHLDIKYRIQVMEILRELSRKGISILMACHDINLVTRYCDRAMLLSKGHISDYGPPNEVITAETIKEVFDIDVKVIKDAGFSYIIPRAPEGDELQYY